MNKIFVGGGKFRRSVFRRLKEWESCQRAMLVEVDPITRSSRNGIQRPHDGFLFNDSLYFTTVDGHVVMANPGTLKIERIIDLNKMSGRSGETLGWCRGLLPLDERFLWVGFTCVRYTKFKENLNWIRGQKRRAHHPSHIALYDLQSGCCLEEIKTEPHGIGVVFSLFQPQLREAIVPGEKE